MKTIFFYLVGGFALHWKTSRAWTFFLGLVDPCRNRLASTAYFPIIFSIILGGLLVGWLLSGGLFVGGFWPVTRNSLALRYMWQGLFHTGANHRWSLDSVRTLLQVREKSGSEIRRNDWQVISTSFILWLTDVFFHFNHAQYFNFYVDFCYHFCIRRFTL